MIPSKCLLHSFDFLNGMNQVVIYSHGGFSCSCFPRLRSKTQILTLEGNSNTSYICRHLVLMNKTEEEDQIDFGGMPIQAWERVFLGANLLRLLRTMLQRKAVNPKSSFVEAGLDKYQLMKSAMELTGINEEKIPIVDLFI